MQRTTIQAIASRIDAMTRCTREAASHHMDALDQLARDCLPSGSGFDSGTKIDIDASKPGRIVLTTAFHHMDENGYYDGWTEHSVIVTPCFDGYPNVRVTGRNRRDIKNFISDTFHHALTTQSTL